MKITEKIITKIEGEAKLKVKEKDGIVKFANIEFWQYRGVEDILVGKKYMDALVINPRICGICGHSHLLATAKAIENALNLKITTKAKILREITTGIEIIQNHIKWFYITLYPTLIKNKSLTLKALNYSREFSKLIAIIAGQYPHNSYIIPGGVTCDITNIEMLKIKNRLKSLLNTLEDEIFNDFDEFFKIIDQNIGKGLNRFLVLGDNLYFNGSKEIAYIKEDKTNSYLQNVTYKNSFFEVGPIARNLDKIQDVYKKYEDSIYTRIIARIKEIFFIGEYLLDEINKIDVCEKSFIPYDVSSGEGYSIIEAPRGPLIHKVIIEDSIIKKYKIIVPTQFNLSNGTPSNPAPAQKALIGEKIHYIDTIFKCFDICAVCVTH
jgi:Ni,Fe-hydrogenase I large subunit